MSENLERRIVAALSDDSTLTSTEMAELIQVVERAADEAEAQLKAARAGALDLSLDPQVAAAAVSAAQIVLDRLEASLPKLDQRYQTLLGAERYAVWLGRFNELVPRHADAVAGLTIAAQQLPKLIEALAVAHNIDAEVRALAGDKPHFLPQAFDDHMDLPLVECAARRIKRIDDAFSLMRLKISFSDPTAYDWPPADPPIDFASLVPAALMSGPGPDWHEAIDARNAARAADAKRVSDFYVRQQAEKDARDHAQEKAERAARIRQRVAS
jgi:hypothetical protein